MPTPPLPKTYSSIGKKFVFALIMAIVVATLVNSNTFIYETLSAYFLFVILSSVLICGAGFLLIQYRNDAQILNWPIGIMMLWILYILFHGLLFDNGLNLRHTYLIVSGFGFISITIIFSLTDFKVNELFKGLSVLAIIESAVCITQHYGFTESKNSFFEVTGTWVNPNVTAMFIAMVIPVILYLFIEESIVWKAFSLIALILSFISLFFLNCRTAYVGVGVSTVVILSQYGFIKHLIYKTNRIISIVLLVLLICISTWLSNYFYKSKQASADGRYFIWGITMKMISEQPILGYGYGMFERNYNLFQAKYFSDGDAKKNEIENATHVKMAYNEMLENTVEGGISGLLLFVGFIFSLLFHYLKSRPKNKNVFVNKSIGNIAFAGVLTFSIMSLCNFTIQAIPAMMLFTIYGGILVSQKTDEKKEISKINNSPVIVSFCFALCLISLIVCISQLRLVQSHLQLKEAERRYKQKDLEGSLTIYKRLDEQLSRSEGYRLQYGKALMRAKRFDESIEQFTKAQALTSNPEVFINKGYCYNKLGYRIEAEQCYMMAMNIQPNRLAPKYSLMKLYQQYKDSTKALEMASLIIGMEPKVQSKKVTFYKNEAKKLLKYNL